MRFLSNHPTQEVSYGRRGRRVRSFGVGSGETGTRRFTWALLSEEVL